MTLIESSFKIGPYLTSYDIFHSMHLPEALPVGENRIAVPISLSDKDESLYYMLSNDSGGAHVRFLDIKRDKQSLVDITGEVENVSKTATFIEKKFNRRLVHYLDKAR